MSGSNLTCGGGKHPSSAAPGGKSPVLLGLIEKKDRMFLKRLQLFFFVREKGKLYVNTRGAFHPFKQLPVKEIHNFTE